MNCLTGGKNTVTSTDSSFSLKIKIKCFPIVQWQAYNFPLPDNITSQLNRTAHLLACLCPTLLQIIYPLPFTCHRHDQHCKKSHCAMGYNGIASVFFQSHCIVSFIHLQIYNPNSNVKEMFQESKSAVWNSTIEGNYVLTEGQGGAAG